MPNTTRLHNLSGQTETFDLNALAGSIERTGWFGRKWLGFSPEAVTTVLRDLWDALTLARSMEESARVDLRAMIKARDRELKEAVRAAKAEAYKVQARIMMALSDMSVTGSSVREKAYALVVSPYQYQALHGLGSSAWLDQAPNLRDSYKGLMVHTARGVAGPLVLTQTAMEAFLHAGPDLDIRRKTNKPCAS
jgi:hypothetical protein